MIIANINRGLDSKLLGVSTKINNQGIHNGVESCIPHCYLINIDKCPNGEMLVSSAGEVTIHITKLRYPTDTFKQLLYSNISLVYPPKLRTKKSMKLRRFCHDSVRWLPLFPKLQCLLMIIWLVVSTPLKNISQLGLILSNLWKKSCSKPPTSYINPFYS